ncbi:c-type cytochrome [Faunimonas sp. B44]|uniref:c-type cytochrome n=1 Tax=Faunimonas sp. B44 TaxID=3461493 RepID=UPI0040445DFA
MRILFLAAGVLALAGLTAATGALAQDAALGKTEFEANCAVCHGMTGQGDGPFAQFIKTEVPDLTGLAAAENGTFPAERVAEIVDGRAEVGGHGPRDMPIWGQEYNRQAVEYYREVWRVQDPAAIVRSRVDALVAHLETLQKP